MDFIDLHKAPNRQLLYDEMVKLMADDKAKHNVLPITKFGLMQITRQRVRPVVIEDVQDQCPTCHGTGKVQPSILLEKDIENQISFLTIDRKAKYINLRVNPYVAAFINKGFISLKRKWSWKYGCTIKVTQDQAIGMVDVLYYNKNGEELLNK